MKHLKLATTTAICLYAANPALAETATECKSKDAFYQEHRLLCASPEMGVDLGFTRVKFNSGDAADKLLNRNLGVFNVFFGFNLNEKWGIEVGYGEAKKKHKDVTFQEGEVAPGVDPITANEFQIYNTAVQQSTPYLSLRYKQPVGEKLHLFAAIGVTPMKLYTSWENTADQNGTPPQAGDVAMRSRTIETRKTIPLVKAGLYYQINSSVSIRCLATWFNTAKFKHYVPSTSFGSTSALLKEKNSIHYSLGLVYSL